MRDGDIDDTEVVSEALESYLLGNRDLSSEILMRIIAPLPERVLEVMRMRMGLGDGCEVRTYSEIGELLNITPERVHHLERSALNMFRHGDWGKAIEMHEKGYRFTPLANLAGADLQNARLMGANLEGANLTAADLQGASLSHANLTNANLTDANLRGAYLGGADLTGALLGGADLTDAILTGATMPDGSIHG
jgi:hypothetical protein